MIDHVICFKVADDLEPGIKDTLLGRLAELRTIPGVVDYALGENFGDRARGFDINMRVTFASRADLDAYERHPLHLDVVAYNRTVTEEHICFDYEWEPA